MGMQDLTPDDKGGVIHLLGLLMLGTFDFA